MVLVWDFGARLNSGQGITVCSGMILGHSRKTTCGAKDLYSDHGR